MSTIVYESELYHHGVLGQKWGVRRYQNADGSLTKKGMKHYSDSNKNDSKKNKPKLTSEEKIVRSEHRKEVAKKVAKTIGKGALITASVLASVTAPIAYEVNKRAKRTAEFARAMESLENNGFATFILTNEQADKFRKGGPITFD